MTTLFQDVHDPIWLIRARKGDETFTWAVRALTAKAAFLLILYNDPRHWDELQNMGGPFPYVEEVKK